MLKDVLVLFFPLISLWFGLVILWDVKKNAGYRSAYFLGGSLLVLFSTLMLFFRIYIVVTRHS